MAKSYSYTSQSGISPNVQASLATMKKDVAARDARSAASRASLPAPKQSNLQPFTRTVANYPGGNPYYKGPSATAGFYQARQANVARQKRIEGMYGEMLKSVGRGGAFEKSGLADIEEARVKGVGEETQSMISSGTYGTTTAAGIPAKHRKIATQSRLKLEDIMQQRELGVRGQMAGFLERIEDSYPDYSSLLSSLAR